MDSPNNETQIDSKIAMQMKEALEVQRRIHEQLESAKVTTEDRRTRKTTDENI
ncbi:hypothetical protein P3L10_029170 [Capsicum annuum]